MNKADPKEHECDPDICTCHEDEDCSDPDQPRWNPNDEIPGYEDYNNIIKDSI